MAVFASGYIIRKGTVVEWKNHILKKKKICEKRWRFERNLDIFHSSTTYSCFDLFAHVGLSNFVSLFGIGPHGNSRSICYSICRSLWSCIFDWTFYSV